jgi:hypothetical protein
MMILTTSGDVSASKVFVENGLIRSASILLK